WGTSPRICCGCARCVVPSRGSRTTTPYARHAEVSKPRHSQPDHCNCRLGARVRGGGRAARRAGHHLDGPQERTRSRSWSALIDDHGQWIRTLMIPRHFPGMGHRSLGNLTREAMRTMPHLRHLGLPVHLGPADNYEDFEELLRLLSERGGPSEILELDFVSRSGGQGRSWTEDTGSETKGTRSACRVKTLVLRQDWTLSLDLLRLAKHLPEVIHLRSDVGLRSHRSGEPPAVAALRAWPKMETMFVRADGLRSAALALGQLAQQRMGADLRAVSFLLGEPFPKDPPEQLLEPLWKAEREKPGGFGLPSLVTVAAQWDGDLSRAALSVRRAVVSNGGPLERRDLELVPSSASAEEAWLLADPSVLPDCLGYRARELLI
ncbi:hypothetical protein DFJ74DRAFT_733433, partial [Hyaloraphidium curvatum]